MVQFGHPALVKMPAKVAIGALAGVSGDQWIYLIVSLNHQAPAETEEKPVQVYPNPASALFYVKVPFKTAHALRRYNAACQLVREQTVASSGTAVYTHGLLPGIYYLQVKGKELNGRQVVWPR